MRNLTALAAISLAIVLSACGGGDPESGEMPGTGGSGGSGGRGSLVQNPPLRISTLSAAEFSASLNASSTGATLLQLSGPPKCGVNFHYMEYGTVGGSNESTNASGAIMVPTGSDPACVGPRPIVLYAHGTSTDRNYNIANISDTNNAGSSEGLILGAMYAAQGFIVVAPNYAGYDISKLSYHPYLNADQQSKDMIDALTAARTALPRIGGIDSGKLLITGYSQGGHVAMATQRSLQAAGQKVTAAAPMSGLYALAAMIDAVYYGNVNLGASIYSPLMVSSYQHTYGNIYRQLSDLYEPTFAPGIDRLLPSVYPLGTLIAQGRLPKTALFSSTPPTTSNRSLQALLDSITPPSEPAGLADLFALGFGSTHLMTNASRLDYLQDAVNNPDGAFPNTTTGMPAATPRSPLRQALKRNDLRNWTPTRPVLLCGGSADPTVFFNINTGLMQKLWSAPSPLAPDAGLLTVLDVDSSSPGAGDPFVNVRAAFTRAKAAAYAAGGTNGVMQSYHGSLVPPFCNVAARSFFQKVLDSGL